MFIEGYTGHPERPLAEEELEKIAIKINNEVVAMFKNNSTQPQINIIIDGKNIEEYLKKGINDNEK